MKTKSVRQLLASAAAAALCFSTLCAQFPFNMTKDTVVHAATISDMPSEYQYAADWIWNNRIVAENSTGSNPARWNSIFDQIVDGKGTLNYVVRWHSTKTITLEQRQNLETALDECINQWTDWLVGYENWPYEHVDVNIVGWAVTDTSLLLDLQPDEIVYTDTVEYVIQPGESSEIPTVMANAPSELSRFDHFTDESYEYPGGLDKRFDQYLWATQGFPDYGGCGGDWGQRLSDTYYIGIAEGTSSLHVQIHEVGHGFGFTDFYGGEGESNGFPPGGFPGDGSSIMMAGSSSVITDFDGWFMRYTWSKIKDETGRFDIANALPETTEPETTEPVTEPETTEPITEPQTTEPETVNTAVAEFTDSITNVTLNESGSSSITFAQNGTYAFSGTDYYDGDDSKNLSFYEAGDQIAIKFTYNSDTTEILSIEYLELTQNIRKVEGDVNADNAFTLTDIVMLQKWLLHAGDITDCQAGDLCEDGKINSFDLCAMKRLLLKE